MERPGVDRLARALGVVLLLGGTAHTLGVGHLYWTQGVPDANRILLDVWIAEAHWVAGALFLAGRRWFLAAALSVWTWALPFLPVLIHRASPVFWVMPILYSLGSLGVVLTARGAQ